MSNHRAAVVRDGLLENVVLVDPDTDWEPPGGTTLVALDDDEPVAPGFALVVGKWTAPELEEVVAPVDLREAILSATSFADLQSILSP